MWNWGKEKTKTAPKEVRGSGEAPDSEFAEAVRGTENQSASGHVKDSRQPVTGEPEQFMITPEGAMAMVKWCFVPLARYDHPAWALTDDEAAPVAPKMSAFIQAVVDRHMPQFMMRMMNQYPEFLSLTYSIGLLYYAKFKVVRLVRIEEMKRDRQQAEENRINQARNVTPINPEPSDVEVESR